MKRLALLTSLLCLVSLAASAAQFKLIDEFSYDLANNDPNMTLSALGSMTTTQTDPAPLPSILNRTRECYMEWQNGDTNAQTRMFLSSTGGGMDYLSCSSDTSAVGFWRVTYGTEAGASPLGDIADVGLSEEAAFIVLGVLSAEDDIPVTMRVTDSDGSDAFLTLPAEAALAPYDLQFPFDDPAYNQVGNEINFNSVETIQFSFGGSPNTDFAVDFIRTELVPEPASLALFGLFSLALIRRRR